MKLLSKREGLAETAVRMAKDSRTFNRVIISTDIPILVETYKNDKSVLLRERPVTLALDHSLMIDVVLDAIKTFSLPHSEWLWLLQPTSPFRERVDFQNISEILDNGLYKSIISVKSVEGMHPARFYTIKNEKLYPLRLKVDNFKNRQELPPVFCRNGCFYVAKIEDIIKHKKFFVDPCFGFIMPEKRSINIDGPLDLEMARIIAGGRK